MRVPNQPKITLSPTEDEHLRRIRDCLAELNRLLADLPSIRQAGCAACRLSGICGCVNSGPRITC